MSARPAKRLFVRSPLHAVAFVLALNACEGVATRTETLGEAGADVANAAGAGGHADGGVDVLPDGGAGDQSDGGPDDHTAVGSDGPTDAGSDGDADAQADGDAGQGGTGGSVCMTDGGEDSSTGIDAEAGACSPDSTYAWSRWPADSQPSCCPVSKAGPALVPMRGGYCIDATEVTRGQYGAWLETDPPVTGQPSKCSWNDSFVPGDAMPPGTLLWPPLDAQKALPVVGVDWCDAFAFCEQAGKRLCGRIGGGAVDLRDAIDPRQSAWYNACAAFPFSGPTYASEAPDDENCTVQCKNEPGPWPGLTPAGSKADCSGTGKGYEGTYDLVGNAAEWEDSCDADVGPHDVCQTRGNTVSVYYSCYSGCQVSGAEPWYPPNVTPPHRRRQALDVGFRCCADVAEASSCDPGPVWAASTAPSACPPSLGGPNLVPIAGGYCIDETEVTRDQYAAWLATKPPAKNTKCVLKTGWEPAQSNYGCDSSVWPPGVHGDEPVVCVDWCDANAFCLAAGKRLCGRIGTGGNPVDHDAENANWLNASDPMRDEWYNACSSGGVNLLTYGNQALADCNTKEANLTTTVEVGSMQGCQSSAPGYAGVYDLSGNVWEWENACAPNGGPNSEICAFRGGWHALSAYSYGCKYVNAGYPSDFGPYLGFRCCAQ